MGYEHTTSDTIQCPLCTQYLQSTEVNEQVCYFTFHAQCSQLILVITQIIMLKRGEKKTKTNEQIYV